MTNIHFQNFILTFYHCWRLYFVGNKNKLLFPLFHFTLLSEGNIFFERTNAKLDLSHFTQRHVFWSI